MSFQKTCVKSSWPENVDQVFFAMFLLLFERNFDPFGREI